MADDKSKVGEPDRSRVTADQDDEVSHLAETLSTTSSSSLQAELSVRDSTLTRRGI